MFQSATTRLTLSYLGIIMAISLFFSFILYGNASKSLDEGLRRQVKVLQAPRIQTLHEFPVDIETIYNEHLAQGRSRILMGLVQTNLLVIILAGIGSYLLARRTLEPIEEAVEAQSRFTADASHELRTPLTAMQTEIEVALRDKKLGLKEAKGLLGSNLEEIAKLRALADGLLTLSRHQSGQQVPFEDVSLLAVAQEAKLRLESVIAQAKGSVEIIGTDQVVEGQQESLVGLVVILVENAIKYSERQPKVIVETIRGSKLATIRVSDEGVGIKASDLPYIFNRFYRADSSRSKITQGYGLGLSIAKQIADMHNGSIEAASVPGKGTQMIVKLPIKQPKQILPV
jgi:two-component system, OmpR family, sensor histidine kinase CiaH